MTREPDDGCGDAEARGDGMRDGRDEFERIVAAWRDEGSVPDWPDAAPTDTAPTDAGTTDTPRTDTPRDEPMRLRARPQAEPPADPPAVHRPGPSKEIDDDHYHPPEPSPLPRPGPPAVVGSGLIILGLVLIAVPETLGMSDLYGLPLGLLGIAAGLTWLVMRMWPSAEADERHDGDDDGAVL